MEAKELPARPNLEHYKKLAKDLVKAYRSGEPASLKRIQDHLQIPQLTWSDLRKEAQARLHKLRASKIVGDKLTLADAQLLIAHSFAFESWPKFKKHIEEILRESSPVSKFESAADAVITGDVAALKRLLRENPELIKQRSTRAHQSTLLHYVSANGVEDFRQRTPKNAVEVTKILLEAGAEVDAENSDYGRGTTLGLVATSAPPAQAGVQIALLELLLEAGASPDGLPGGWNPLTAALANGRGEAAEYLAMRGARLDLEGASGVGRLDLVKSYFSKDGSLKAKATKKQMKDGFAWACEYGRSSVAEFLLDQGMEIDARLRNHGSTGIHWAAYGGHVDIVRLLLARKARLDIKDESFEGTPLEWALHSWGVGPNDTQGRYYQAVALLVAAGATVEPGWLADPDGPLPAKVRADPRMLAALRGEVR
jgi:ankyrin repeat protein